MNGARNTAAPAALAAVVALSIAASARDAAAVDLAIRPLAGVERGDAKLDAYGWDGSTHAVGGAEASIARGAWGGGLRVERRGASQSADWLGEPASTQVSLWSVALVGERSLVTLAGARVAVRASAGRLFASYSPSTLTFAAGDGAPVEINFEPWSEWMAGAGLGVGIPLSSQLALGVDLERWYFALDTAHRRDDTIVRSREAFGQWTGRIGLAWRLAFV
jgi:hypothetical protein